ncbi:MAG: glutamate--tRNA ligase family protein, partial [Bacteroidota bacterium]
EDEGAIRFRVPDKDITVHDRVCGYVTTNLKEKGSRRFDPETKQEVEANPDLVIKRPNGGYIFHFVNVVDDIEMGITHVIRGEEWLPSAPLHILLYRYLGWEESRPQFAHLPLLLKPDGNGKLSKRDGQKLGIPVFPLAWEGATPEDSFTGFRAEGFDPKAVINFLVFLGWNPGTEQEIFSMEELTQAFSLDKIGKSGARFDYEKATWFNQQYLHHAADEDLLPHFRKAVDAAGYEATDGYLLQIISLLKERISFYKDLLPAANYFFAPVEAIEEKVIRKKWKSENRNRFEELQANLSGLTDWNAEGIKAVVLAFMEKYEMGFGAVLPIIRVAMSGSTKGPDAFAMMEVLGQDRVVSRLASAY